MLDLPRSLRAEPRPPDAPHRVRRDWALLGALVPLAILEGFLRPDLPYRVLTVAIGVALVPTLLWRRTAPLAMLVIAMATTGLAPFFTDGHPPESGTMAYLLLLVYALARWGSGQEALTGLAVILVQTGVSTAAGHTTPTNAVAGLSVAFSALTLGATIRYRAGARTRMLDQAKLVERERLARDLHDTVAHHVSAIAIRAQAGLAMAPAHPKAATEALALIESEASTALAEMRTMVRVLRKNLPADRAPTPGVADLDQLAGRTRSGPPVDVGVVGDVGDLPPSVDSAIFRLAQESVTNARRHARHATRIEVRVAADATSVRLRVTDDGDTAPTRREAGYGLIGMIERADLLGGTCEAGPNEGRGWTVTAVLPRSGATA